MKKPIPPTNNRRPTATIDLKAEEVRKDNPETPADTASPAVPAAAGTIPDPKDAGAASSAPTGGKDGKPDADKPAGPATPGAKDRTTAGGASFGAPNSNVRQPAEPAKPKPATAAAPSGRASGGLLSQLGAAIVGAVLGILGISFANNQNLLPEGFELSGGGGYREAIIALEDKISALDARASASGKDSLGAQITALTARLEKAESALGEASGERSLAAKVAALESTIGNLEAAAKTGDGGELAGLTAVTRELTRANEQASKLNGEFIKMRDEQSAFRDDLAGLRSDQADFHIVTARLSDELAKLRANTAKIVADASRPPDVSAQIAPLASALDGLKADVGGLMQRESGSRAEGRNIALALSLGELKRAVNQGVPYRAELQRVAPHAPKSLDLTPLAAHADRGLVTAKTLRDQFAALSNTAQAAESTAASGSLVDQLVANARTLVQVRPSGLVEGDTTSAILARMEYRFDRGDLAGCLQESESLRGEARRVMQAWLERAGSRLEGDNLLTALEDRIRTSLAGDGAQ